MYFMSVCLNRNYIMSQYTANVLCKIRLSVRLSAKLCCRAVAVLPGALNKYGFSLAQSHIYYVNKQHFIINHKKRKLKSVLCILQF